MTLLRTYIVLAVLRGVATVMAVLVAVACVMEFIGQLNDVGTGAYEPRCPMSAWEFRARFS
jgi:Na+-transporting methylmalonyl-CoA/oxaloacetate decarboxylase gamma subunit